MRDWADWDSNAVTEWVPVETTQLVTGFPATGDGSARNLWLDGIYTKAWGDPSTADDDVQTYLHKFDPIRLDNGWTFVAGDDDRRAVDRMRIARVRDEFGAHINVTYAIDGADEGVDDAVSAHDSLPLVCPQGGIQDGSDTNTTVDDAEIDDFMAAQFPQGSYPSGWDDNDRLCFPSSNDADAAVFHKYVVTQVEMLDAVAPVPQDDGLGGIVTVAGKEQWDYLTSTHTYNYLGRPAWDYSDSVMSERADMDGAWNVYRGFAQGGVLDGGSGTEQTSTQLLSISTTADCRSAIWPTARLMMSPS